MAKLHELLAAERTPTGAWNTLLAETRTKFGKVSHYFTGHSKSLSMIEESEANRAVESQNREEKPVVTSVWETLRDALRIYAKAEDLQAAKNATNAIARGDIMWKGEVLLAGLPVDELLGLEARLAKIRELFDEIPTLDATKQWDKDPQQGDLHIWVTAHPEVTVKTKKMVIPILMAEATEEHPAQVQAVTDDVVIGRFTTIYRSGAATSEEKAIMIETIDELLVAVKKARMRANETEVVDQHVAQTIIDVLLEPLNT